VLQRRRGRRGHGWRPWSGGVEEVGWGRRRATSSLGRARGEARPLAWRKRRAQRQQTVARVEALVRRRGGTERHERSKEGEIFRPRALGQYIWMEHHYRDKARTGSDESHHCRCKATTVVMCGITADATLQPALMRGHQLTAMQQNKKFKTTKSTTSTILLQRLRQYALDPETLIRTSGNL
jgi:hypothetical protein